MKRMVVILGVIIGICIANNGECLQFQGGFDKKFKGEMPIFNKSSDNNIRSPEQFNTKENFFDTPEQAIDNFSSEYFATPYIKYNLGSTYEVEFIDVQNVSKGDLPEKLPKGFDLQKNNTRFYKVKWEAVERESGKQLSGTGLYQISINDNNMIKVKYSFYPQQVEEAAESYFYEYKPNLPHPFTNLKNIPQRARRDKYVVGNWVSLFSYHEDRQNQLRGLSRNRLPREVWENGRRWHVLGKKPKWVSEREGFIEIQRKFNEWLNGKVQWKEVEKFIYSEELEKKAPRVAQFAKRNYGILAGETFDVTNPEHKTLIKFYLLQVNQNMKESIPDIASNVYKLKLKLDGPLTEKERKKLEQKSYWIREVNGNEVIVENTSANWVYDFYYCSGQKWSAENFPFPFIVNTKFANSSSNK